MHKTSRWSLLFAGLLPLAAGCGAPLESTAPDTAEPVMTHADAMSTLAASWTANAPMLQPREHHTLTLLDSGLVLAAGGDPSAELYNPYSNTWTATGSLNEPRRNARAVRLASGKVLIIGGQNGVTPGIRTAELYDPATGTWSYTGSLNTGRSWFTATLLDSGKVLVTGGMAADRNFTSTAEVYDPDTGTWSYTGPRLTAGFFQAAARLYSGEVLVTGSISSMGINAEVYNPSTHSWRAVANKPGAHAFHALTRLYSGEVLLTGGGEGNGDTASAWLYNPYSDSWTRAPGMNRTHGMEQTATLLYSGKLLVTSDGTSELYDPDTRTWTLQPAGVSQGSTKAVLLHTGQVLTASHSTARYTP